MSTTSAPESAGRLVSLDVFRGATIALMVLVNTPGDGNHVYAPLRHAEWNGWTPTDVVFPSFMWIAGLSMTLSFRKRLAAGASRGDLFRKTLWRSLILYGLGLLLYGFPGYDLTTIRLMGVLQRFAFCGLAGAAIYLTTGVRGRIAWLVGLLVAYWALMTLVPVPGFGPGRLDLEGNLAHYVDRVVLGRHNYAFTQTWDPEGIVSTLPAIGTWILGLLAGDLIALQRPLRRRLLVMTATGVALVALGLLCSQWLPINKKLWTSSFALFMAGLDCMLFAIVAWPVDVLGWQKPVQPFVIVGMNSIAIYMLSEMLDTVLYATQLRYVLYQRFFAPLAAPVNASLLYAVAYVLLNVLAAYALYRRGWFIRV